MRQFPGRAEILTCNCMRNNVGGWEMRVRLAVTRITPGQTLRQNGNTARENELFKPSAASSASRIWGSKADRSLAWKSGAGSSAR